MSGRGGRGGREGDGLRCERLNFIIFIPCNQIDAAAGICWLGNRRRPIYRIHYKLRHIVPSVLRFAGKLLRKTFFIRAAIKVQEARCSCRVFASRPAVSADILFVLCFPILFFVLFFSSIGRYLSVGKTFERYLAIRNQTFLINFL